MLPLGGMQEAKESHTWTHMGYKFQGWKISCLAGYNLASSPGPFKKSEKRAWYPLFAHVLNFPTFQEFYRVTSACRDVRYVYFAVYLIVHC